MDYFRPSPMERPTPLWPQNDMKTASTPWSSESFTMRKTSMNLPWATPSTMGKSPTSTSPWVVGFIKRPSGYGSMTMAPSQAISAPRAPTSSLISLTSTLPPTTASTPPSLLYLHGSDTYSRDLEATSTSSKPLWPRLMTGAWHKRSRGTERSTTTSHILWSKSKSISRTLRWRRPTLHHVSLASCLPKLQSVLKCFVTCRGKWQRCVQGGRVRMENRPPMYEDIHCKEEGDDTGLGAASELAPM